MDVILPKTKKIVGVKNCKVNSEQRKMTLASMKKDFNLSSDMSKLSYCLMDFLSHFEMYAVFLSSRKRSSACKNERNLKGD